MLNAVRHPDSSLIRHGRARSGPPAQTDWLLRHAGLLRFFPPSTTSFHSVCLAALPVFPHLLRRNPPALHWPFHCPHAGQEVIQSQGRQLKQTKPSTHIFRLSYVSFFLPLRVRC